MFNMRIGTEIVNPCIQQIDFQQINNQTTNG